MVSETVIETGIPAPVGRVYRRRMTPALEGLKPGESVVLDRATSVSVRDYGRHRGWRVVTKQVDGEKDQVRLWRVE